MNPLYFQAQYLKSALHLIDAPVDDGFEVAFAGRSNSGKSTAINTITAQKSLARTSKTPGRTQLLNFFALDETRRLVDFPGYGYAKVPDKIQKNWGRAMETYLEFRKSLRGIFLLMDIRHPLTEFDWQMIEFCQHCNLPLHIALTKADKLSRGAAKGTLLNTQAQIAKQTTRQVEFSVQLFSAPDKIGIDEAHVVLDHWMMLENNMTPSL